MKGNITLERFNLTLTYIIVFSYALADDLFAQSGVTDLDWGILTPRPQVRGFCFMQSKHALSDRWEMVPNGFVLSYIQVCGVLLYFIAVDWEIGKDGISVSKWAVAIIRPGDILWAFPPFVVGLV